jgi:hypothetical protein
MFRHPKPCEVLKQFCEFQARVMIYGAIKMAIKGSILNNC